MNDRSIFLAALDKSGAERAAYLDEACAGDDALRWQVERLLRAHAPDDSFLEKPAVARGGTVDYEPLAERPGFVIGPYKLLQQIGEGGMGTVYMAEQQEPIRRMVAIKIIKPGMDRRQVIARFESERQALALMDHPNIAHVLDAGTTDAGRPYFVMELVKGVPITKFCDEQQLTPRERLELFVPVCQAVQHAHQKGIIHRDLKPSNVLVALYDDRPVPKVIDFGVAKATAQKLTERTLFTEFGAVVGTLEYMSPEQAKLNALDVDTRSDIYSLGVLLYEVLTGSTPLNRARLKEAALDEVLRLIREEEAPKPSTRLSTMGDGLAAMSARRRTEPAKLGRIMRGELDWIALKALEKDRTRRYETANGLARDVERYLKDEPVEACPPSLGYRAGKFLRKYKAGFTLAGTAAAMLLVGTVLTGWQAWLATVARQEAVVAFLEKNEALEEAQRKRDEANQRRREAEAARLDTRRAFYAQTMILIPLAWQADDRHRVAKLLDGLRPAPGEEDLRSFEWHYWDRRIHPELRSAFVAETRVTTTLDPRTPQDEGVAMSGDGMRVAFPCYPKKDGDPVLKVVAPTSGEVLFSLPAREGRRRVFCLTLSHDGRRLAFLLRDPQVEDAWPLHNARADRSRVSVEVWDVDGAGDRPLFARKAQRSSFLKGLAFSPAGNHLVTAEGQELWDATTDEERRLVLERHRNPMVKVWDLTNLNAEAIFKMDVRMSGNDWSPPPQWAFNPDGTRLALVQGGYVEVWEVATGKRRGQVRQGGCDECLTFSPDGKRLVGVGGSSSNREGPRKGYLVRVWEGADGDELKDTRSEPSNTAGWPTASSLVPLRASASYSPDGNVLAVYHRGVSLLNAATGAEMRVLTTLGQPKAVAFGDGGKRLYVLTADPAFSGMQRWTWMEWDVSSAQVAQTPPRPKEVTVYERSSAESPTLRRWELQRPFANKITVRSPDGERLATYRDHDSRDSDGNITVTDRDGKVLHAFRGGRSTILGLAFSPNGRVVFTVGDRTSLDGGNGLHMVWETDTGKVLREFHAKASSGVGRGVVPLIEFVSPDGRLLVVPGDDGVRVVNFDDNRELFSIGDAAEVYFSDEQHLVSIYRKEKTPQSNVRAIKVWDVNAGRELSTHSPADVELAFSSDGSCFLAHKDGESATVLKEVGAKQRRIRLKGTGAGEFRMLRFSPDGTRLVTTSQRIGIRAVTNHRVWDVNSGKELFRLEGPRDDTIAFSPDSKRIVAPTSERVPASDDKGATSRGVVKLLDATTGQELLTLDIPSNSGGRETVSRPSICTPTFSPGGRRLTLTPSRFMTGREKVHTWDATPRAEAKQP